MRIRYLAFFSLVFVAVAGPAFAQATNPYNVSWSALDPGNDWAAQVLRSMFPIAGGTAGSSTGNEATVIGPIAGQVTGFVAAIAAAFVAYITIINIHRAAETSRILGTGQSWMFVVRVAFAGIMMFPLAGGFSAGQALVLQAAMTGIGMAKVVYTNAVQAVGPDAMVVAPPMIPGTEDIVAGLIDSELCMDLVNLAANATIVPIPQPITAATAPAASRPGAIRCLPATNPETRSAAPSRCGNRRRTSRRSPASASTWPPSRRPSSPTCSTARSAAKSRMSHRTSGRTKRPHRWHRCKASFRMPSTPTPAS
jgi:conjugal transfer/type IV secretion protein DotA/TraY